MNLYLFSSLATFIGFVQITKLFGSVRKCKTDDGVSQRCMPAFENVALDKDIVANNTCGIKAQSEYCMQNGKFGSKLICDFCYDAQPKKRHPANLMTDITLDKTPTWWQSETLFSNNQGVHLILDFKKKYTVAFVKMRFHSIRPHSFAIYKKSTYNPDEKWLPYQYFSQSCRETYDISDSVTIDLSNQKIALCTDRFSGMMPLSGGNVAFLTLNNRPGKYNSDNYPDLQEWITVTALKIDLDKLNTFGDEVFGDPKVLKSYYFAVSDIAVGGRCKCNGHASKCTKNTQGRFRCECDHNTAGIDCEKCLPLYNDQIWRPAGKSANPCKACDCNGLADECVFDEKLWIDSKEQSGGRCVNCQKNTGGINCEKCKDYFYRKDDEVACKPCGCNKVGSVSLSCNQEGKCICKLGVKGDKCDKCKDGHFEFSDAGCKEKISSG